MRAELERAARRRRRPRRRPARAIATASTCASVRASSAGACPRRSAASWRTWPTSASTPRWCASAPSWSERHGEPLHRATGAPLPLRGHRAWASSAARSSTSRRTSTSSTSTRPIRARAGALSLHEFFARLCERLTRAIADVTDDGFCFRVDLRLRPEGTRGPLCNSLGAAERYYESFGRPWERQAWVKARAVAGDRSLGDEALDLLEPFVWPRSAGAERHRAPCTS